jgi:hypothetical protein
MQLFVKAIAVLAFVFLALGLTNEYGWYVFGPFLAIFILLIGFYAFRGIRELRSGNGPA